MCAHLLTSLLNLATCGYIPDIYSCYLLAFDPFHACVGNTCYRGRIFFVKCACVHGPSVWAFYHFDPEILSYGVSLW